MGAGSFSQLSFPFPHLPSFPLPHVYSLNGACFILLPCNLTLGKRDSFYAFSLFACCLNLLALENLGVGVTRWWLLIEVRTSGGSSWREHWSLEYN